jgi:P27 family predicted phage terminase small subunit
MKGNRGGRPPLSATVKALTGRRSESLPYSDAEPDVETQLPDPPLSLSNEEKATWRRIAKEVPRDLAGGIDVELFTELVRAKHAVDQAWGMLQTEGFVILVPAITKTVTHKNGTTITTEIPEHRAYSPWNKVHHDAAMRLTKMEIELGFTPTSRARIGIRASKILKEKGYKGRRFSKNKALASVTPIRTE